MIQIPYHQMSAEEAQELTAHLQRDPDWLHMSSHMHTLVVMTMLYNLPSYEMLFELYIPRTAEQSLLAFGIKYERSTWKTKVFRLGEEEAATQNVMRQMTAGVAKAAKEAQQFDIPAFDINDIHFVKD